MANSDAPDTLQVRTLSAADHARWEHFIENAPEATFFHRAGWKEVIETAFSHRAYYFYAEQGGEIKGVLPLVHVKSRLFGNSLISLPFCAHAGVVASHEPARLALEQQACALAQELQVDYLEMRNRVPRHPDWPTKDLYVNFGKTIDADMEKNTLAIPRKQRAMVRKGIDANLAGEIDTDIGRFYDAYSQGVRNLGTPVFSRRYFRILQKVFGKDCDILTITQNGNTVSSVMSFYFRDQVLPYYGGGTSAARAVKGADFMYWELMRRICERGFRVFDYGRSKIGSGSFSFKKNWGFVPEPLYYEYYLVKAEAMPNVSPTNPKYRYFIEGWKRLPLPVSRVLGPWLARDLG